MTPATNSLWPLDQARFLMRAAWQTLRRGQQNRDKTAVEVEYSTGWEAYRGFLAKAKSLDQWLRVPGVEDVPDFYNVGGRLVYEAFDSSGFYRGVLADALRTHFPAAKSIAEFGCGVGRNLLFLRRQTGLDCYGYELCRPGVEVADAAARKFDLPVKYAQLDYVNDGPEKYCFPETDVGFTMFSLEQVARQSGRAVRNILDHVGMGTIHIEPVPENYPMSVRGMLGRIEHRRVDYLSGFDAVVRELDLRDIVVERLLSAHNPLMFPTLYVLRKR
jgi:SAM-dependent methyltransferase